MSTSSQSGISSILLFSFRTGRWFALSRSLLPVATERPNTSGCPQALSGISPEQLDLGQRGRSRLRSRRERMRCAVMRFVARREPTLMENSTPRQLIVQRPLWTMNWVNPVDGRPVGARRTRRKPAPLSRIPRRYRRRGWDLNPRDACTSNGFQDRPVRPLRHPAGVTLLPDALGSPEGLKHVRHVALEVLEDRERHAIDDCRAVQRVHRLEARVSDR